MVEFHILIRFFYRIGPDHILVVFLVFFGQALGALTGFEVQGRAFFQGGQLIFGHLKRHFGNLLLGPQIGNGLVDFFRVEFDQHVALFHPGAVLDCLHDRKRRPFLGMKYDFGHVAAFESAVQIELDLKRLSLDGISRRGSGSRRRGGGFFFRRFSGGCRSGFFFCRLGGGRSGGFFFRPLGSGGRFFFRSFIGGRGRGCRLVFCRLIGGWRSGHYRRAQPG